MALRPLTIADFCAGTGMLSEAVRLACAAIKLQSDVVVYVEREAAAAASIVARMEAKAIPPAPVWDDLATFDGRAWRGLVDIVAAGIPCQPWSTAGKRLGQRDARHLGPILCDQVAAIEPSVVFVENVAGYLRVGYRELRERLGALGYQVAAGLFSSAECGASHQRKRLFILGVADAQGSDGRLHARSRAKRCGASDTSGRGFTVADATGGRKRQRQRKQAETGDGEESRTEGFCEELADSSSVRWRQDAKGEHGRQPESANGERSMANLPSEGRGQMLREDGGKDGDGTTIVNLGRSLPYYAPARNDFRSWAAVAALDASRMPSVESEVRRVLDGLAPASDQLRLVGNGVDPLVAAYAFLSLLACFGEDAPSMTLG